MRKDKDEYNAYMRAYMKKRYRQRRRKALQKLGGRCQNCESKKDLQIDHVDPTKKSFSVSKLWSIAEEKFWKELEKCQLLCQKCHSKKSIIERGMKIAKGTHGTLSSYRYCHCKLCKAARRKWATSYRARKKGV